jgi:uncharacterized membrane protein
MPVIFGFIGAALGAALGDWSAAVLGFGVGFLLSRLTTLDRAHRVLTQQLENLRDRHDTIERELRKLQRDATVAARPADVQKPAPEPVRPAAPVAPHPTQPPRTPVVTPPPLPAIESEQPAPSIPRPIPEPPTSAPASAAPMWLLEFFTTGNVVAKVGMVIVFFGVAFLVRYAADRGLLPIEFRLMAVAAGSLVMLGIGWYLRTSKPDYAMVLQGGAVGLLYLTIFAAFRLYGLLPGAFTFALLVAVVVISSVLAVLQDSLALAAIGTSGGFLAPILASTGGGSHVALFSYYAVLNAGVLGIAWFRAWQFLNWLAFVFTFGIGLLWGQQFYQPGLLSTTEPFLIFFFLLFLAVAVLFAHRQAPRLRGYIDGTLVFGAPAIAFTMQSVLVRDIPFGRAYSAVVLSALYLALTRALWRRDRALRQLAEAFLALAVVFLILAVPLAFAGHATAAAWALEGTGLIWIGVRQQRLLARLSGAALLVGAGIAFAVMDTSAIGPLPVLNARFLACVAIAAGSVVAGFVLSRARSTLRDVEVPFEWGLLVWGLLWWFGSVAFEIDRHVEGRFEISSQLLAWAGSMSAVGLLARWWKWRAMMLATIPIGPFMWLAVIPLFVFESNRGPLPDLGWLAWLVVVGASYLQMFWFEDAWPEAAVKVWHAATGWLAVFLVTWALAVEVTHAVPETPTWSLTIWCLIPALFLLALRTIGRSISWPVQRFAAFYRSVVPLAPAAGIVLWVVWAFGQSGSADPLPYVPIVNPLELVQAVGLIAVYAGLDLRERVTTEVESMRRGGLIVIAVLAFIALNVIVARVVHFYWGVAFDLEALIDSPVFQTGISILWGLTAGLLMTLARMRINRSVWLVGAGVLAALIVKLFLVDLGHVGGVARIVSFLATGVLILAIGYFAPAPPKAERAA